MKKALAIVSIVGAGLVACASKPATSEAKVASTQPTSSSPPRAVEPVGEARATGAFPDGGPLRLVGGGRRLACACPRRRGER